jgi:hypothetical protein
MSESKKLFTVGVICLNNCNYFQIKFQIGDFLEVQARFSTLEKCQGTGFIPWIIQKMFEISECAVRPFHNTSLCVLGSGCNSRLYGRDENKYKIQQ